MRFLVLLACLGAAVALPSATESKLARVQRARPVPTLFAANLAPVKPEIAAAYNRDAELAYWKEKGHPNWLPFADDEGKVKNATVLPSRPLPITTPFLFGTVSDSVRKVVEFHFFNKNDENDTIGTHVWEVKELVDAGWDTKLPVKIIVHGFINSIKSPVIQKIKDAYLSTGKYNVIGVDWNSLCGDLNYFKARDNVNKVGAVVGAFVDELITAKLTNASQIHIIGHSLGAHVSGIAGKSVVEGSVARITGLDPAGPLFWLTGSQGTIYHTDAELVDIIHTNAGLLGKDTPLGDIDFYLNGGFWQPFCGDPNVITSSSCSHGFAYEVFADSIKFGSERFEGHFCPHVLDDLDGCMRMEKQDAKDGTILKAFMGDHLVYDKKGIYLVNYIPPKIIHY